jgi:hypothetical protein
MKAKQSSAIAKFGRSGKGLSVSLARTLAERRLERIKRVSRAFAEANKEVPLFKR